MDEQLEGERAADDGVSPRAVIVASPGPAGPRAGACVDPPLHLLAG